MTYPDLESFLDADDAYEDPHHPHIHDADADEAWESDLEHGDRWSTWPDLPMLSRGPMPYPDWVVTSAAAVDEELGILKTGKEADVFLVRRFVPDGNPTPPDPALTGADAQTGAVSTLLAAKRYRDAEHRQFHRTADYLDGRRTRKSRDTRAIAKRTAYGRSVIAGQWAHAEFAALTQLFEAGVPVPYPVQIAGTELLIEFIGTEDGAAAPRLAQTRPGREQAWDLWEQLTEALVRLAELGYTHGDLSPYNLLVHEGRLVVIDVPQIVDVVAHTRGMDLLRRDIDNVAGWFASRGIEPDVEELFGRCAAAVVSRW